MKKTFLFLALLPLAATAHADGITDGIGMAGDNIYSYTPYIQAIGYVLAAIIGLVGAFSVYTAYINNAQNIQKRMLTWGCGTMAMLCMTIALPKFFDYQESGLLADAGGSTVGGGTGSYTGGDRYGQLDTSIPSLNDGRWIPDGRFQPITINGTRTTVSRVLNELYAYSGGGSAGSYGRTLDIINKMYWDGHIDTNTYNLIMSNAGNLPHS